MRTNDEKQKTYADWGNVGLVAVFWTVRILKRSCLNNDDSQLCLSRAGQALQQMGCYLCMKKDECSTLQIIHQMPFCPEDVSVTHTLAR